MAPLPRITVLKLGQDQAGARPPWPPDQGPLSTPSKEPASRKRTVRTAAARTIELGLAFAVAVMAASVVHDTWNVQTDAGFEERKWAVGAMVSAGLALAGASRSLARRPWYWTWSALALATCCVLLVAFSY